MLKLIITLTTVFVLFSVYSPAQLLLNIENQSSYYEPKPGPLKLHNSSAAGSRTFLVAGIILALVNPELVIENKKAYFGLTKELSVGKYPYGRLAFEYTHIFRDYSRNHLRFSYNQDFVLNTKGQFFVPIASAGAGYFTDTDHKGYFAQASFGFIIPLPIGVFEGLYIYLKGRHTFVEGSLNSNITDISLGTSFLIYY